MIRNFSDLVITQPYKTHNENTLIGEKSENKWIQIEDLTHAKVPTPSPLNVKLLTTTT